MRKVLITTVCALVLGWAATPAKAATISLTVGDAYFVGVIVDGIPSSLALEAGYISTLITLLPGAGPVMIGTESYDRSASGLAGPLPSPTATDGFKSPEDPVGTGISVVGFSYILGKYDADKAGAFVWLVSGIAAGDTVSLPSTLPFADKFDLSHYSLFKAASVPDGGATLGLLGLAMLGLGYVRRRIA